MIDTTGNRIVISFLVRLTWEPPAAEDERAPLQGSICHLQTGEEGDITSSEMMLDYLLRRLDRLAPGRPQ